MILDLLGNGMATNPEVEIDLAFDSANQTPKARLITLFSPIFH